MPATVQPPSLIDSAGRPVALSPRVFATGGEGTIYEVVGEPNRLAKVYKSPQDKERSDKLLTMAARANDDLLKIAAWPIATLHAQLRGPVAGILMPKIAGYKEIHHLYSVKQRKEDFPDASWRFLVHAAMNCAIAFEAIHHYGHVVGDVNQKNVLVSSDAVVQFVDCDSFQVRSANGHLFRCVVGVPEYTPQELHGKSFRDVDRNENNDLFGLAVLIFHLLMMGRHPYSGVYLGHGDMPLEKAIKEGRFAYAHNIKPTWMKPPPNTLPIAILDSAITQMFERAFSAPGPAGPPTRPTAKEWKENLDKFLKQLVTCRIDRGHVYPKNCASCPWCQLLRTTGVFFFVASIPSGLRQTQDFDLLAVWGQIERTTLLLKDYRRPQSWLAPITVGRPIPATITPPTSKPCLVQLPSPPTKPDPFFDRLAAVGVFAGLVLLFLAPPVGLVCLVGFGGFSVFLRKRKDQRLRAIRDEYIDRRRETEAANRQISKQWEADNSQWFEEYALRSSHREMVLSQLSQMELSLEALGTDASNNFGSVFDDLRSAKAAYEKVIGSYSSESLSLSKRSNERQLVRYLDSHLIERAKIPRLTTDKISTLRSFGIESALDVERLQHLKVPGIGEITKEKLFSWRESVSRTFKPVAGYRDPELTLLEQKRRPRIGQLESVISAGPGKLSLIKNQYNERADSLFSKIQDLGKELQRANADVTVMDEALKANIQSQSIGISLKGTAAVPQTATTPKRKKILFRHSSKRHMLPFLFLACFGIWGFFFWTLVDRLKHRMEEEPARTVALPNVMPNYVKPGSEIVRKGHKEQDNSDWIIPSPRHPQRPSKEIGKPQLLREKEAIKAQPEVRKAPAALPLKKALPRGNFTRAIETYKELIRNDPNSPAAKVAKERIEALSKAGTDAP